MSQRGLPTFAPGIVLRLRIVFFAMSVALVCVMLVTFGQMRFLNASIEELTETSFSTFVTTEETERTLKSLLLLLHRVDGVQTLDDLAPLGILAEEQLDILGDRTRDMAETHTPGETVFAMQKALTEIDIGTRSILKIQKGIMGHEANIAVLTGALEQSGVEARTYFEEMSYAAALVAQNKTANVNIDSPKQLEAFVQDYNESLALANTVTTMSLEVEAVIDAVIGLQSFVEIRDLSIPYNNLRHKMRNIAVLTGQLADNETRTNLARVILEMRAILFGDDGVVAEVSQLHSLRDALAQAKQAQFAPIERISGISAEMLAAARAEIDASRQRLEHATQRVITILVAVLLLMLLAITATLIWVVERQINKRMARLTKAVLAIADGETSYEVNVSGPDELGKMANALQVFKSTAEELHRSNAELEKFAYVAAHDLRSPLRAIQDLSGWLLEDEENVFSGEGKQYMALMTGRIERLNQLLTDLLEYSRAGSVGLEFSNVSIKDIVQETAEMLDPMCNFEIGFVGSCESVVTYETPLRQILLNLINNALKHHDEKTGKVTVDARVDGDRLHCQVQDDGAGIDPKYHSKIFGLFQTLKSRDEVEASGLGLAIIHKLLERLGGKISVESNPDTMRGTSFVFDVPIKAAHTKHIKKAA